MGIHSQVGLWSDSRRLITAVKWSHPSQDLGFLHLWGCPMWRVRSWAKMGFTWQGRIVMGPYALQSNFNYCTHLIKLVEAREKLDEDRSIIYSTRSFIGLNTSCRNGVPTRPTTQCVEQNNTCKHCTFDRSQSAVVSLNLKETVTYHRALSILIFILIKLSYFITQLHASTFILNLVSHKPNS